MSDSAAGLLAQVLRVLGEDSGSSLSEAELVDRIALAESLKSRLEALQATDAVRLEHAVRERHRAAGLPSRRQGEGVASQIALARRISPHRAARLLTLAKALHTDLPSTLASMRAGRLSEWRASLIARETALLTPEHRSQVDHELAAVAPDLGDRRLADAARKAAYRLDPQQAVERAAKAESDRHVSIRPAPDLMTQLSALLPVKDGVACYAALKRATDTAVAAGDERSRGQIMADTLVARITGREHGQPAKVEVKIVISDAALLAGEDEPGEVTGYGPVPAAWVRALSAEAETYLRRLYARPDTGELVAMESRSRKVPQGLAEFIHTRDGGICRIPGCNAPIRHTDHAERWTDGGHTAAANLQGLCERCNQAKEAEGWRHRPLSDGSIEITAPTGHTYLSRPPGHRATDPPCIDLVFPSRYRLVLAG